MQFSIEHLTMNIQKNDDGSFKQRKNVKFTYCYCDNKLYKT